MMSDEGIHHSSFIIHHSKTEGPASESIPATGPWDTWTALSAPVGEATASRGL
jgi:hypothetical protein